MPRYLGRPFMSTLARRIPTRTPLVMLTSLINGFTTEFVTIVVVTCAFAVVVRSDRRAGLIPE